MVQRHPWKRLLAWLVDWLLVLVWAGVTAAVGIPLFLSGATAGLGTVALNVISVVVLVVPVTVVLAALESGRHRATIDKRLLHLEVTDAADGYRLSFRRAFRRNVAYVVSLVYGVSLFVGAGRTPYDRITASRVNLAGRQ